MIVSWNWLKQYVDLDMPLAELEQRLMMAGLNHEDTEEIDGDLAVDLEVTSNRPDCLGHLGVAREVAVLWDKALKIPPAEVQEKGPPVEEQVRVRIDCLELCFRYTARVIRGVKIAPSPGWMARRLETVGITPINNVVDISNYVLMECGQPLHTFDFGRLEGSQIIVREPKLGETIEAIDHKNYVLPPGTCVIADTNNPVAIGGVMGGAATEISRTTRDILIEAAEFEPVAIRTAARTLNLHSDSSYRFERRIDAENIDWASRRCCELILELAGGQLCQGVVDVGPAPPKRKPITLRLDRIPRILGIDVPVEKVRKILTALGNEELRAEADRVEVIPPSWRRDLSREIDLIEEVARIHGYDAIPQDVGVPMVASTRRPEDRVAQKVRGVLTSLGYDEAITLSVVDEATSQAFSPWTEAEPLASIAPVIRGADRLRLSLIPSLLAARRTNQSLGNADAELFEIARVYLPRGKKLPEEQLTLGLVCGAGFTEVKGAVETILAALDPAAKLEAMPVQFDLLDSDRACRLTLDGNVLGYLGEVGPEGLKQFELRQPATIAELRMDELIRVAKLVPQYQTLPTYPAVTRDLNLVVDETVRWADVASTVCAGAQAYFEDLAYVDTYRDEKRLGKGKKSLLMTLTLRWSDGTMTNQEADRIRDEVVAACGQAHGAELRA
ncbi:MAG: phenylalanine--tRNA ligase subunit beta [Pirellulales bacterium]|nr:phenylalanine--tRNA ligase subunit beta [Pirellulales bacterium]